MAERRLVWDLPLRAFHWLLVLGILGLFLTAKADADWLSWLTGRFDVMWMPWHFRCGYFVIGLLLFRVIWGFVGPKHARFGHFLPGPKAFLAYLATVAKRDSKPSIGHNPMGAVMVVVMLLMVAAQAASGLFTSDDITWAGPFFPSVSTKLSSLAGMVHHRNFAILQWVIGLHILAIVFYKLYKRQPLVSAMIHGRKSAEVVPAEQQIASSRLALAVVVAVAVAGLVYWVISQAPPPAELGY